MSVYGPYYDDDLIDVEAEAAHRVALDQLLRVARGTLTAAEAALRRARADRHAPASRIAFLTTARDNAERTLREMLEGNWT